MPTHHTPRRRLRTTALLLAAGAALAGCSTTADPAGQTYHAVQATGHEIATGSEIVLAFTADEVGAQAGCNASTAPATWDDGVLRLAGEPTSSRMACAPDLMAQDEWVAELLASEPALDLDGEQLTVSSGAVSLTLVATE